MLRVLRCLCVAVTGVLLVCGAVAAVPSEPAAEKPPQALVTETIKPAGPIPEDVDLQKDKAIDIATQNLRPSDYGGLFVDEDKVCNLMLTDQADAALFDGLYVRLHLCTYTEKQLNDFRDQFLADYRSRPEYLYLDHARIVERDNVVEIGVVGEDTLAAAQEWLRTDGREDWPLRFIVQQNHTVVFDSSATTGAPIAISEPRIGPADMSAAAWQKQTEEALLKVKASLSDEDYGGVFMDEDGVLGVMTTQSCGDGLKNWLPGYFVRYYTCRFTLSELKAFEETFFDQYGDRLEFAGILHAQIVVKENLLEIAVDNESTAAAAQEWLRAESREDWPIRFVV